MIIPSQLPQIITAARSGALQKLALQAGQVLDGRVVGPAPNGGTQVQISGQLLNLLLPQATMAGDLLRFEVQSTGAQIRLALQGGSTSPQISAQAGPVPTQTAASSPTVVGSPASSAPQPQAAVASSAGSTAAAPTTSTQAPPSNAAAPASTPPAAAPNAAVPQTAGPAAAATPAQATAVRLAAGSAQTTPAAQPPAAAPSNPATANPATPALPTTNALATQPAGAFVPRPAALYAQSAPAAPAAPGAATASVAAAARPTGTVPQANAAPAPITAVTAALPSTPEAALADMVQRALPQQNSVVSLTSALTSIAGQVVLPESVAKAAQQVLANRVVIEGGKLDGGTLQKAVLNSGVFQEATLARAGTPLLAPQADMKTAMLALRQTLTNWLGQQPQLLASVAQVAPPFRGRVPRVRAAEIPPIDPAAGAEEVGKHLLDRTESALSRLRLHQHASLPDPKVRSADWSADLPVVVGGHQTLLQLQIHRDEHNASQEVSERGWQMRFAINLPGLGEVGAQVSLRGGATGVMLWAAERTTSEALEADLDGLRGALAGAGLATGAVIVRHGAPPESQLPSNAGHFVDSRR
ncbi:MAG: flagellar hook-length control protein FliK [Devosia sp.]